MPAGRLIYFKDEELGLVAVGPDSPLPVDTEINIEGDVNIGDVTVTTTGGSLTDGSGDLVSGGSSEEVFAANPDREYLLVQNVDNYVLWVNFGTAAVQGQPSIKLNPGGSIQFPIGGSSFVPTQSVNVVGNTTAQEYTAKEA